jgi:hypothetical protein
VAVRLPPEPKETAKIMSLEPELHERFRSAAKLYAADTLSEPWQILKTDQQLRSSVSAGLSLEYLAKACLSKRHPSLVYEYEWRLLAEAYGIKVPGSGSKLRTVNLQNAISRLKDLGVDLPRNHLATLNDGRNDGVHFAKGSWDEARTVAFLELTDALLLDLGESRVGYWGSGHIAIVQKLLGASRSRLANEARLRIDACRDRMESLPQVQRQALVRNAGGADPLDGQAPYDCPACTGPAVAVGHYGAGGDWRGEDRDPVFSVEKIGCPVCGLRLGANEMRELSLETLRLYVTWSVDWDKVDPEPDWGDVYAQQEIDRIRGK